MYCITVNYNLFPKIIFDNGIRIRVFGPRRYKKIGWSWLNNEELNSLHRSPHIGRDGKGVELVETI